MANNISTGVWRLDTPGSSVIWPFQVRIGNISWTNYPVGAAGTAVLQDGQGNDVFNASIPDSQTSMMPITTGFIGWCRGLKLISLSGGELLISVGAGK